MVCPIGDNMKFIIAIFVFLFAQALQAQDVTGITSGYEILKIWHPALQLLS